MVIINLLLIGSYKVMLDCWNRDPCLRPTFTELVSGLDALLTTTVSQVCRLVCMFSVSAVQELTPVTTLSWCYIVFIEPFLSRVSYAEHDIDIACPSIHLVICLSVMPEYCVKLP